MDVVRDRAQLRNWARSFIRGLVQEAVELASGDESLSSEHDEWVIDTRDLAGTTEKRVLLDADEFKDVLKEEAADADEHLREIWGSQ